MQEQIHRKCGIEVTKKAIGITTKERTEGPEKRAAPDDAQQLVQRGSA
jgi:hypothetical protein